MTIVGAATHHCKKAMKLGISLFRNRFNSSKCKTMAKMTVARIKLLRNKRQVVVRQMRRDIAMLLESKQDATARVRVEHVIREQNIMAANEFIELFCELIVARLTIIAKQRQCPADLKEGISSVIFAAPRCSDIPELLAIRDVFEKKYGKDFVSAATDLRPNAGVNRTLIEKLSVRTPSGEVKLKVLKEIAKEFQVDWDTKESEMELLKPPEERIEGPTAFTSAATLPIKPISNQSAEHNIPTSKAQSTGECNRMEFENSASAAEAAAESAKKAIAAAEVAAYLADKERRASGVHNSWNGATVNDVNREIQGDQFKVQKHARQRSPQTSHYANVHPTNHVDTQKIYRRHSYNAPAQSDVKFDESDCDEEMEIEPPPSGGISLPPHQPAETDIRKIHRRYSYNVPSNHSDIKFDEPDCDDDSEMDYISSKEPPARPAPRMPGVHPKLPDYETLAARFEALKYRKK